MEITVRPRLDYVEGREMFDRPEGLRDCGAVFEGVPRTWKEYVPASYDGTKPVPLVLTLHGGHAGEKQNNHKAEKSTAWAAVADREGFLVVYPQSLLPTESWTAWDDFENDPRTAKLQDDLKYLDWLLERIEATYNIDHGRIYLHGQSFGDVTASYYLLQRPGNHFAAAATLSGPVGATRYFREDGACRFGPECGLPVVRTHGATDISMPMGIYDHLGDEIPTYNHLTALKAANTDYDEILRQKLTVQVLPSNELWRTVNETTGEFRLSVRGRYNAVTWPGQYDFHFYMVEGGGHGPSMDMADFIWSYFFSGWQYVDGKRIRMEPMCTFTPDSKAVALADGAVMALVDNQAVQLSRPVLRKDDTVYVAAEDVTAIYPGLAVTVEGLSAVVTDGVRNLQISASNRTYVWQNHMGHGERTFFENGILFVPAALVGRLFFGFREKNGYGVSYLSEAEGQITFDFAFLLRQMLGTEQQLTTADMYALEKEILDRVPQPGK